MKKIRRVIKIVRLLQQLLKYTQKCWSVMLVESNDSSKHDKKTSLEAYFFQRPLLA